jgi:hypothetical protein
MAVLQLNKHGGKILSNGSYLFSIRIHKNPEYFAFNYGKNKMNKNIHVTKPTPSKQAVKTFILS